MSGITGRTVFDVVVDGKTKTFDTVEKARDALRAEDIARALLSIRLPVDGFEAEEGADGAYTGIGESRIYIPFGSNMRKLRSAEPDKFVLNEYGRQIRAHARAVYDALKSVFEPGAIVMDADIVVECVNLGEVVDPNNPPAPYGFGTGAVMATDYDAALDLVNRGEVVDPEYGMKPSELGAIMEAMDADAAALMKQKALDEQKARLAAMTGAGEPPVELEKRNNNADLYAKLAESEPKMEVLD